MNHTFSTALTTLFVLALLILAGGAAPAAAQEQAMSWTDQVIALTNEHRAAHGCPALVQNEQLAIAAQRHSEDMALSNYMSHTSPTGATFADRISGTGYAWSRAAENIAVGFASPAEVVHAWMNSPGHRANILNCELREVAVGVAHQMDDQADVRLDDGSVSGPFFYYWTQEFATPAH
jgi:uncharacterized protein YkwD